MKRRGFKEQVEEALRRRHLNLGDLAERMGTTLGYASRLWNDDEDRMTISAIEKVCSALNVDPLDIDLWVEKQLPMLARDFPSLTSSARDILAAQRGNRKGTKKKSA